MYLESKLKRLPHIILKLLFGMTEQIVVKSKNEIEIISHKKANVYSIHIIFYSRQK
jgi:hypothetical protein